MATREVGKGTGYRISTDIGVSPAGFDKDVRNLERAIRSSQTPQNVFGVTGKAPTAQGGVQQVVLVKEIGVNANLQSALKAVNYAGGRQVTPQEIPFRFYEGSINLKGDEAKKMLQSVVEKFGGQITKTLGDEVFYTYALEESLVQKFKSQKKSPSKMFESKVFKGAQQASLSYEIEQAQKEEQETLALQAKQEEKQRLLEDKKQKAFEQKERNAYNREQQRVQRQIERLEGKTAVDGRTYAEIFESSRGENAPVLTRKEELEEYKRIEAEDKKAKEEQAQKEKDKKEAESSRRQVVGTVFKIIGAVTVLASIARRILTAVTTRAQEARQGTLEANAVGMTYQTKNRYDTFDIQHGMPAGTTFRGIQDIQQAFGDVTNLDERKLGILARVMGSEVQDLVRSGMGGKEPDKLMEHILDKYFMSYKSGKNSLGQQVGQEQARRELYSVLSQISPAIATQFNTMIADALSGVYGNIENVQQWRETTDRTRRLMTDIDYSAFSTFGQQVNELMGEIRKFVNEGIMKDFTLSLSTLISKIRGWRIGMDESTKVDQDAKNVAYKESTLATFDSTLGMLEDLYKSRLKAGQDNVYKKYQDLTIDKALESPDFLTQIKSADPDLFRVLMQYKVYKESRQKLSETPATKLDDRFEYSKDVMNLKVQEEIESATKLAPFNPYGKGVSLKEVWNKARKERVSFWKGYYAYNPEDLEPAQVQQMEQVYATMLASRGGSFLTAEGENLNYPARDLDQLKGFLKSYTGLKSEEIALLLKASSGTLGYGEQKKLTAIKKEYNEAHKTKLSEANLIKEAQKWLKIAMLSVGTETLNNALVKVEKESLIKDGTFQVQTLQALGEKGGIASPAFTANMSDEALKKVAKAVITSSAEAESSELNIAVKFLDSHERELGGGTIKAPVTGGFKESKSFSMPLDLSKGVQLNNSASSR